MRALRPGRPEIHPPRTGSRRPPGASAVMNRDIKSAVNAATLRLLEPLARFLLDARIGIGEFSALARLAYVRAAIQSAAGAGAYRINVSRVAAATGLTRVEVAALLAEQRGAPPRERRGQVRAERVLAGWWNDADFQDGSGAPAHLTRKGRNSFAVLVKRYSGDNHNAAAILDELLCSQAVRERADGTLEAVSRTCATVRWDEEGIAALGEELAEHFETLLYNLKNPDHPRFARRVVCGKLDAYAARVVIPELAEQAEIFLEGAQDALNHPKYSSDPHRSKVNALRVAVALQFFQEPATPRPSPPPSRRSLRARDAPSSRPGKHVLRPRGSV